MRAIPLTLPLAWSCPRLQHLQRSRIKLDFGSDCLAHPEILR
jgi:hypothetical protein